MGSTDSAQLSIFWFRRDLRLEDNHGLLQALRSGHSVLPVFIFDKSILASLGKRDARVEFIHQRLEKIHLELRELGSGLNVFYGEPMNIWRNLIEQHSIKQIYCNEDYEPYALSRDARVADLASKNGIGFHAVKDQVIFAKDEVRKDDGTAYRVFTPFSKRWKAELKPSHLAPYDSRGALGELARRPGEGVPSLAQLGFESTGSIFPPAILKKSLLRDYAATRNLMGIEGTSHFGVHLRFGTISVRKLVSAAREFSEVFLSELIWREFFMQLLWRFPRTVDEPFDERYKAVAWRDNLEEFERWREGNTGFPVVDAGMRELARTGFMHNRARMITASFLAKHLLIDWRKGERHFASLLLDFELASNVGNWQWVAGCGCDAAPYFRVFNPTLQAKKFDADGEYVRRWVPEVGTPQYPEPMVDHEMARRRAIVAFKTALKGGTK